MSQKEISHKIRMLHVVNSGVISMFCAVIFIMLEHFILSTANSQALAVQNKAFLTLPLELVIWFFILYGLFIYLAITRNLSLHFDLMRHDPKWPQDSEDLVEANRETALDFVSPIHLTRYGWFPFLNRVRNYVRDAADSYGVRLPSEDRCFFIFCILPILICSLLFGIQIADARMDYKAVINESMAGIQRMEDAAKAQDLRTRKEVMDSRLKPLDRMTFSAYLEHTDDHRNAELHVELNAQGKVRELKYIADLDPKQSHEDNLRTAKEKFALLHEVYLAGELPQAEPGFEDLHQLSPEFSQAFLSTSYETELDIEDENGRNFYFMTNLSPGETRASTFRIVSRKALFPS